MKNVVFTFLMLVGAVSLAAPDRDEFAWDGRTSLDANATVATLNAIANDAATNQAVRARAVFSLFASLIRPGQTAQEVHQILRDTGWLDHVLLHRIDLLGGWIPVEGEPENKVFCLLLFPETKAKKWNDWPSAATAPKGVMEPTAPHSDWRIYIELSGEEWEKEDAVAFLRGKTLAGNPKLVEFALCLPHPTSPGHFMGRIERFSNKGVHVYEPW